MSIKQVANNEQQEVKDSGRVNKRLAVGELVSLFLPGFQPTASVVDHHRNEQGAIPIVIVDDREGWHGVDIVTCLSNGLRHTVAITTDVDNILGSHTRGVSARVVLDQYINGSLVATPVGDVWYHHNLYTTEHGRYVREQYLERYSSDVSSGDDLLAFMSGVPIMAKAFTNTQRERLEELIETGLYDDTLAKGKLSNDEALAKHQKVISVVSIGDDGFYNIGEVVYLGPTPTIPHDDAHYALSKTGVVLVTRFPDLHIMQIEAEIPFDKITFGALGVPIKNTPQLRELAVSASEPFVVLRDVETLTAYVQDMQFTTTIKLL